MIRPLRQRHRRVFTALAIFLPAALTLGLFARRPVPAMDELPAALAAAPPPLAAGGEPRPGLFAKTSVQARVGREQKNSGRCAVELSAGNNFARPDVVVYWAAGNPGIPDTLPANAVLLGALGATPLARPDEAAQMDGVLILYSVADGESADVSKPVSWQRFNAATP